MKVNNILKILSGLLKMKSIQSIPCYVFDNIEEKYGVTRETLKKCLSDNWNSCKSYRDLQDKIYDLLPESTDFDWTGKDDELSRKASREYFDWYFSFSEQGVWDKIRTEFIRQHGMRHTLKEAATIAADYWINAIFKEKMQDNGDDNWHSIVACYLATNIKERAISKYSDPSIKEKVHKELVKYYIGSNRKRLDVDYYPQQDLYDILVESGISKDDADRIAPIKTNVSIDFCDYSVVIFKHGISERR